MAQYDARSQPVEAREQRRLATGEDTASADDTEGRDQRDPEEPDVAPAELPRHVPSDVDPADAYEQTRSVDYDEDDYR